MKSILSIVFVCLVSLMANAQIPNYSFSQEVDHSVQKISSKEVNYLKSTKSNSCHAYTRCQNGAFIQCRTYGQGCSFYTQPYQYVQCTGYNQWGQWVRTHATCY